METPSSTTSRLLHNWFHPKYMVGNDDQLVLELFSRLEASQQFLLMRPDRECT